MTGHVAHTHKSHREMSHRETEAITARHVATITPAYGNLIEADQRVRGLALQLVPRRCVQRDIGVIVFRAYGAARFILSSRYSISYISLMLGRSRSRRLLSLLRCPRSRASASRSRRVLGPLNKN